MKKTIVLLLLTVAVLGFSACGTSVPKYATGPDFVKAVKDTVQLTWAGAPPDGGEKPRVLTPDEQQKVIAAAQSFQWYKEWKNAKDVVSVETNLTWIGWVGLTNGESFVDYQAIVKGDVPQNTIDNMGTDCFPGVSFLFHSKYGDSGIAGMRIAVNLKTNQIVFSQGFDASVIAQSQLPAAQ